MFQNNPQLITTTKKMSIMKKHILLILVLMSSGILFAQQDPQFTHYMYNSIAVNPAYAGSREALTVGLLNRNQWIGLKGAPTTQNLYIHSPLKNERLNLGLSMLNDKIGPVQQTSFNVDFAYRFPLTEKVKLAFGLKGGIKLFQAKLSELATTDPDDPDLVGANIKSSWTPNLGFGVYLNSERWYAGVGVPKVLQSNIATIDGNSNANFKEIRHYFFIAGAMLPVSSTIQLKPSLQVKSAANAPISTDVTLEAIMNNRFSIGAGHRLGDSFSALVGMNITEQFHAGLSWDFTTSRINQVSNGSIEFFLRYDFLFKNDQMKSPRYF